MTKRLKITVFIDENNVMKVYEETKKKEDNRLMRGISQ
jgi:hypothetical protein